MMAPDQELSLLDEAKPVMARQPSFKESVLSGIIKSISNSCLYPRPLHSSQAPNGLLNEKDLGSISCILIPQSLQAKFWLKLSGFPPITSTCKRPSESLKTVSILSVSLLSIPFFITNLSTTISILCFIFLSRFISSSSEYSLPSILTLEYPDFLADSKTFSCLPFFPLTT